MNSAKDSSNTQKRLAKGGIGVFAMRIVAMGLAFAADSLLTNSLGLERYDVWAAAASWLAILTVVAGLGMNIGLVRHLPADQAHKRFGQMRGMIRWTSRRMLSSGIVLGILLFSCRHWIAGDNSELATVLGVVAFMLPLQGLNLHRQAVLQALKHPVLCLMPDQVVRPLALIAGVLIFIWLFGKPMPHDVAWIWLGSLALVFLAGAWWKHRLTPPEVRTAIPEDESAAWSTTTRPLLMLQIAGMLIAQADPAMLGFLGESGQAGIFAVSNRIALLLGFGLAAVNAIAAPLISQLHATGKRQELQDMLTLAAKGIALYTVPAAIFMVIAGPWLLRFFGAEFEAGYVPLMWLVAGQTFNALAGSVGFILTMTGHQGVAARIIWVSAIGKIALNFLLMPKYGALGGAIGTALMLAFWNCWLWLEVRRRLDLEPTILSVLRRKKA